MIKQEITEELKRRLAWILLSYNGINNFISYLKESLFIEPDVSYESLPAYQKLNLFNNLHLLLQFENNILLISPWSLFINLRNKDNEEDILNSSININEPYQVFSTEGNLLYTVKNHLGVFGESRLDKNLLLNSVNTSMYFLKYRLYNGQEQIKLLLVNMHSSKSTNSNSNFKPVPESLISNLSIINNSGTNINVYKTDTFLLDRNTQNSYFSNINNLHTIVVNNSKTFNISSSCYFFIDPAVGIDHTYITYPLNNIIFIEDPNKPFFVGSNIDVTLLNKTFNKSLQFSNKPLKDIITLIPFSNP
jgi:hypothetical protein